MGTVQDFVKTPASKLDYTIDWSEWLPDGDSVIDSEWDIPEGLSVINQLLLDGSRCVVWLEGGRPDHNYLLTNTIVTQAGRREAFTQKLRVR